MKTSKSAEYANMTYKQMAANAFAIRMEVKKRNPLFVNLIVPILDHAVSALKEIYRSELKNPASECGPRERR